MVNIIEFIKNAPISTILNEIDDIHPVDFLESLSHYAGDKYAILEKLPDDYIALIIDTAEDDEKYDLLSYFSQKRKKQIMNEMSSDELVDLLGYVEEDEKDALISQMSHEDAQEVQNLLSYKSDTAGGIMATEFIAIRETMTIADTIEYLRQASPNSETPYYIYVVDGDGVLKGVVPLREIIIATPDRIISDIMNTSIISVPDTMDQEDVGILFEKYGFMAMPVVDAAGRLIGIVTFDDIFEIIKEEYTEDLFRLAGLDEEEKLEGTIRGAVASRLPWLIVNLFTALLAAGMVSLFEGTISKIVALAAFMPIVAGMGGNAGTQTLTMIIRGIALGELTFENQKSILVKEAFIGLINGCCLGLLIGALGAYWEGDIVFGIVIGSAIFLNLIVATLSGYFVPLGLKKVGVDPALASSIFVTTLTDVLGFFFFLGLATVLLL